jgi:hypothetical protein
MNLDDELVAKVESLRQDVEIFRGRACELRTQVLGHFNTWAVQNLRPYINDDGIDLDEATKAVYSLSREGFVITLGEMSIDGMLLDKDYYNLDVYEAVGRYEKQTPWVCEVDTGFYLPK